MLLAIGTRVKLRSTGDEGVITELLGNGLVSVYLEEVDMEIPTFEDNLERPADKLMQKLPVKAKIVPGKQEKQVEKPPPPLVETQYRTLKSKGLLLGFDPILAKDNSIEKYTLYLINDTLWDAIFTVTLYLNGTLKTKNNGKIAARTAQEVGTMTFNQLNDNPELDIECWKITTTGTEGQLSYTLKIKPKQFFKKSLTAPLLNRKVHLYSIFKTLEQLAPPKKQEDAEDLRHYTERNLQSLKNENLLNPYDQYNVKEFAEFIPEIDLHIERLTRNFRKMSNSEIIQLQLEHFDEFLERAIRLGVSQVFVIHGIGKGTLRDTIATRLAQNPNVKTFKNEYHPRYGWGATEVIL